MSKIYLDNVQNLSYTLIVAYKCPKSNNMGSIHKLKPEIKEFILEQKKLNPAVSCRGLSITIKSKFQVKISKSSINAIFKETGLSMPIGRRSKKSKPQKQESKPVLLPRLEIKAEALLESKPVADVHPKEDKEPVINEPVLKAEIPLEAKDSEIIREEAQEIKPVETAAEKEVPIDKTPQEVVPEEASKEEGNVTEEAPQEEVLQEKDQAEKTQEKVPSEEIAPQETLEQMQEEKEPVEAGIADLSSEKECSGAILLKALDSLAAGSHILAESISKLIDKPYEEVAKNIQWGIFQDLVGNSLKLGALVGDALDFQDYYYTYQTVSYHHNEILDNFVSGLEEVRGIKMHALGNSTFYLDGQFRSVWFTPHIPHDFFATLSNVKKHIQETLFNAKPLILFTAPTQDFLAADFIKFLRGFEETTSRFNKVSFYTHKLEELSTIDLDSYHKNGIVFALWPYQLSKCAILNQIGHFRKINVNSQAGEYYITEFEVELPHFVTEKGLRMKGCLIKTNPEERVRLAVVNNVSSDPQTLEDLTRAYLLRWPNLEESLNDYNRKVEFFSYTGDSFFISSAQKFIAQRQPHTLKALLEEYLKYLDFYFKKYFLPAGFENKDFSTIKSNFYDLKATLVRKNDCIKVSFCIPESYIFRKELTYALRRLNERGILFSKGIRLEFGV